MSDAEGLDLNNYSFYTISEQKNNKINFQN